MKQKILLAALMVVAIGLFASVNSSEKGNALKKAEENSMRKELITDGTIIPPIIITPPVKGNS